MFRTFDSQSKAHQLAADKTQHHESSPFATGEADYEEDEDHLASSRPASSLDAAKRVDSDRMKKTLLKSSSGTNMMSLKGQPISGGILRMHGSPITPK